MPNAQSAANNSDYRKGTDMKKQKQTILYARLSVDDGTDRESNSIQNQCIMLEEYAERNDLKPYVHINDDGYSGTGWDRPGWQKIIEEIKADNVSNLVVKNLDRMGRDYLRVGLYMEMFREKGVRLIAINDGIDTLLGEDDFTPFRAIMAEWYARDASKKIKAVMNSKGKSGKPLANIPPYGYVKDPEDKNKWLVDPEAAAIVTRIFNMTIDGMGPRNIATKLFEEKVERPSYYMAQRGIGRYKNTCDTEHLYAWNWSSVTQILGRIEYAGHTANFKGKTADFKNKKYVKNPREEWLIFENTHEAIVTQETWDLVQKLRQTKRRKSNLGEANPLTGLIYCADCNGKLFNHRRSTSSPIRKRDGGKEYYCKPQNFYVCSTYKRTSAKYNKKCTPHVIQTGLVKQIILELLQETNGYIRENKDEFIELIREKTIIKKGETAKTHAKRISKNVNRIAELERIFRSLYEDKALGKISSDRFDEMSAGYEQEQEELKAQNLILQTELEAFNTDNSNIESFIELVNRFTHFDELTPAMINEFVDKIIVHEGEWSEGRSSETGRGRGTRTQKVEVFLKYVGSFNVPDKRTPEEIEAERIKQERIEHERKYKREYRRRMLDAKKNEEKQKPDSAA